MRSLLFGFRIPSSDPLGVVSGFGVSPGSASGRARIVLDLDKLEWLTPGEILVCPFTAPPWAPLFATAGAVVTNAGGVSVPCRHLGPGVLAPGRGRYCRWHSAYPRRCLRHCGRRSGYRKNRGRLTPISAANVLPAVRIMAAVASPEVPPGINYRGVSDFFAANVPGGDCELSFSLISGGRSNLTYLAQGGERKWVVRRPPLGHVLPTAHDMAREYRVLEGVSKRDFPAPRPIALCEDSSINEYPFYVMDYREGVILDTELPDGFATTPVERREIGLGMVRTLAALHSIDFEDVGLAEFGRPWGYVERQVRRWAEQWERSKTADLPQVDELIDRLRNAIPESPAPAIVHGDYRLGNIMLDFNDPRRTVAVLDWEMATLGDPLADLGYTLIYWGNDGDSRDEVELRPQKKLTMQPGFLTREELIGEYAGATGSDVSKIDFYQVLAIYKLAVITEGIYARFLKGQTVGEGFGNYDRTAERLMD